MSPSKEAMEAARQLRHILALPEPVSGWAYWDEDVAKRLDAFAAARLATLKAVCGYPLNEEQMKALANYIRALLPPEDDGGEEGSK